MYLGGSQLFHHACALQACDEEKLLGHLGVVLYEYLGEEYPEVLGSILGALKAIVNVIGMTKMTPPIKDLLPRLTPILKNRHEKVRKHTLGPMLEACWVIQRASGELLAMLCCAWQGCALVPVVCCLLLKRRCSPPGA